MIGIPWSVVQALKPRAIASSAACCLFNATCAAMTRCLSAIRLHLAHAHSLYLQCLLCPLSHDTIPWFLQRAHFGFLVPFSVTGYKAVIGFIIFVRLTVSHVLFFINRYLGVIPNQSSAPSKPYCIRFVLNIYFRNKTDRKVNTCDSLEVFLYWLRYFDEPPW